MTPPWIFQSTPVCTLILVMANPPSLLIFFNTPFWKLLSLIFLTWLSIYLSQKAHNFSKKINTVNNLITFSIVFIKKIAWWGANYPPPPLPNRDKGKKKTNRSKVKLKKYSKSHFLWFYQKYLWQIYLHFDPQKYDNEQNRRRTQHKINFIVNNFSLDLTE